MALALPACGVDTVSFLASLFAVVEVGNFGFSVQAALGAEVSSVAS